MAFQSRERVGSRCHGGTSASRHAARGTVLVMDRARLSRIFQVLIALAEQGPQTVTEISRALNAPVSSTHDLLTALTEVGAIVKCGGKYGVGAKAIQTSLAVMDSIQVRDVAERHLRRLHDAVGLDVCLAVCPGSRPIYLSRIAGRRSVSRETPLGRPLSLHATAVGKLFAAFDAHLCREMMSLWREEPAARPPMARSRMQCELDAIRRSGVSISRGEGLRLAVGVATAVCGDDGETALAAVHVSSLGPAFQLEQQLHGLTASMKQTSLAIACDLANVTDGRLERDVAPIIDRAG